jgi:ribA/ribD-fused uncharacterized protein
MRILRPLTGVTLVVIAVGCSHDARPSSRPVAATTAPTTRPAIDSFQGEYRFLSNFHPAQTVFEGITYPTSEHAYQAAKSLDPADRRRIATLPTPAEAKRAGRALPNIRADWEQAKFDVMERVVRDKFTRNVELREKLLATGDAELIEGNTWGDRVWGVYEGQGENHLGRILMKVRAQLRSSSR